MKIHLIYLAAGSARRFGSNKLLYLLNGKPLFQYGLETLVNVQKHYPNCTLTVVSRYPEILSVSQNLGVSAQYCAESIHGISHTIRCGIHSINHLSSEDYLVFMVADQPYITPHTIIRLLEKTKEKPLTACICFGERVGNPAMFSATLAGELCNLEGDQGGRAVIRKNPEGCLLVSCDTAREMDDIDTPAEIM